MEANKKANELYEKFKKTLNINNDMRMGANPFVKECCLNTVNEIIETAMTGYLLTDKEVSEFQIKMRDYWQQVKIEIEKL